MAKNGISTLSTKQAKQIAKLNLASLKRQGYTLNADGTVAIGPDTTANFYRARNSYDITELPTQYNNNGITDNSNVGGLIIGRPWVPISYVLNFAAGSVDEGATLAVGVTVTPYIPDGTTLYWTIQHITTSDADFVAVSGSFTVTSGAGSFNILPAADNLTEGAETFTVYLRANSITGPVLAVSSSETVNDTSLTPTATGAQLLMETGDDLLYESSTQILLEVQPPYEQDLVAGTPITYVNTYNGISLDVKSTNFNSSPANGSYIKVNGTTIASDTTIGLGTLMTRGHTVAVLNPSTGATISITSYDTYGAGTTGMQTALNALSAGSLIVVATYDATSVDAGLRTVLQNSFGSPNPGTWPAERHSHIFIGMKQ